MAARKPLSRRDTRREQEIELRRRDVLAAAAVVFSDKGFQGAQVAEIANAAEVSLNTVYGLFKGKEELYEAVIHAAAATVRDRVRSQVDAIVDPGEKLLTVIDALFACFDEQRHLLQIYARTTHGLPWRVRQALGEDSQALFHDFSAWVVGLVKAAKRSGRLDGLDAETVALSLIGAVTTTAARWVESPRQEALVDAAPKVRSIFEVLLARS
jgi:AcrR family transcriptional regulator